MKGSANGDKFDFANRAIIFNQNQEEKNKYFMNSLGKRELKTVKSVVEDIKRKYPAIGSNGSQKQKDKDIER